MEILYSFKHAIQFNKLYKTLVIIMLPAGVLDTVKASSY